MSGISDPRPDRVHEEVMSGSLDLPFRLLDALETKAVDIERRRRSVGCVNVQHHKHAGGVSGQHLRGCQTAAIRTGAGRGITKYGAPD